MWQCAITFFMNTGEVPNFDQTWQYFNLQCYPLPQVDSLETNILVSIGILKVENLEDARHL